MIHDRASEARILLEFIIRPLLLVTNPMRSAVSSGSLYGWRLHGLGSWNITARTLIVSDEMGGRLVIALRLDRRRSLLTLFELFLTLSGGDFCLDRGYPR